MEMKSWALSAFPQMAHEGVQSPTAHCDSEAAALTQGSHRSPKETVQRFGGPVIRPWRAILCFWQFTHTHTKRQLMMCSHKDSPEWCHGGQGRGWIWGWETNDNRHRPFCKVSPARPTLHVHRTRCTRAPSPRWGPGPDHSPVSTITNHSTHLPWVLFVCFPAKSIVSQLKKPGRDSEMHKVV